MTKFKYILLFIITFGILPLYAQIEQAIDSIYTYHENGIKKELRLFKDEVKVGTWITWDENENITAKASFKNGLKDGKWCVWNNGVKLYQMFYKNGEKIGTWTIWDKNGIIIEQKKFK